MPRSFLWSVVPALMIALMIPLTARAADPIPPSPAPAAETPAATTAPAAPAEAAPEPAAATTLFMDTLKAVGVSGPLDSAGILIYGYVEGGFTGRLTGGQDPLPLRVFDGGKPNNARLHQLKLTIERPIDKTKTFDFGGRADMIYGRDARFIHAVGLTDNVVHEDKFNDLDLEQLYVQTFIGKGNKDGEGLDITFGKWVTPFGAEVIDAPGNTLFSRGLLFNFAIPFTHTGVKANYTFGPQASAYMAVVRGWDNWNDHNESPSYIVGGILNTAETVASGPRASLALNVITGPEQEDNTRDYRTVTDVVATYRWNDKLTQMLNFDYGTEANGTGTSASHWAGLAHYLTYAFTDTLAGTFRAEWFQDKDGVRTGIQGNMYELTVGVSIQPFPKDPIFKNLSVRPELRWDFADEQNAFGGNREDQVTAGFDIIFKF